MSEFLSKLVYWVHWYKYTEGIGVGGFMVVTRDRDKLMLLTILRNGKVQVQILLLCNKLGCRVMRST